MKPSEFVKILVDRFQKRVGVFKNQINAENWVPKNSSKIEQALFLFYTISLDYSIKSQFFYQRARQLFSKDKKLFSPQYVSKLSGADLLNKIILKLRPRYPKEAALRFEINSCKLLELCGGNPLKIFSKSKSAQEVLDKIYQFRGFGPKISNFFFRAMANYFQFNYPDIEKILPPVDVHDIRIAYLLGYIKSPKVSQKNTTVTKMLWSQACKKANISWLVVDRALWILGSEGQPKSKKDIFTLLRILDKIKPR